MVLVTTTASKQALLMREMAGPEKMPWVRMAYTLTAPADINLNTEGGEKKKKNSIKLLNYTRTKQLNDEIHTEKSNVFFPPHFIFKVLNNIFLLVFAPGF